MTRAARPFAGALLAALCALQMLALLRAPAAWMPARVDVVLARGATLALDHAALGAPARDGGRLQLRRDAGGTWWAADDGASSPLLVHDGTRRRRGGSVVLAPGQHFQLGALRVDVAAADAGTVSLSAGGTTWRYDGALLRRDGKPQPACPDARLGTRLAGMWNRIAPAMLAFGRPLVFGGNLDCGNRIAVPGVPAPAAAIARSQAGDGLDLAAAPGVPLLLAEQGREALLSDRPLRLGTGATLAFGRTRLLLATNGDVLHLRPAGHVALYPDAALRLPAGVTWTWTRRTPWDLPAQAIVPLLAVLGAACAGALASSAAANTGTRLRAGAAAGMAVLLAGAGAILFWLQRTGAPAGAGVGLLVAWAALAFALAAPRRLDPVLAAALPLLALGLLAQLDLGLGAPDTAWLRHFHKTAALLALGTGAAALAGRVRPARPLPQARIELALLLLTGVALVALLLQVAYGDETGVFDLQPVEFAKLALAALSAHCLALACADGPSPGGAWRRGLRLAAPALLFMLLLGVALVQVDDYSPLVLLALWSGTMMLAQALATRRRAAACALVCVAAAAVLAVVLLRGAGADGIARWDFYADRFLVWLDPGTHPHTGQQLLLGARAIAQGGWRGVDGVFGVAQLGLDPGFALRIPAVQDDFAASFFVQRHGLLAAVGLWLLQALFLCALLRLAVRCWLAASDARDFRIAWLARLRCFFLAGGAAFAFGHFLLSWGTNLAIFPVMGQPMSFLSAGGSHLLFFICPLLGAAVASSQSLEENESCRSTSNMKL
ncbi:FtsW/RodA/SpoVE family cell cycle protein [Massilia putida]|uniref:FtsW/RodA/SpoVE family cell cycle protein n=1 Tax=Massilia putida TaxID=1141883 RepID=UPI0009512D26|nr:FtsW/RodA/SpoVE family cell cycle protein [Massilia putida]